MRKRRSQHGSTVTSPSINCLPAEFTCQLHSPVTDNAIFEHQQHPQHHNHSIMPPLNDTYEKSSREFEDIFDIDIDTLPPSFFAEALGSLIGESGESSLLTEDTFLDSCSTRYVKRCYSAPPSPLAGLLADFDDQGSVLDLMNDVQNTVDSDIINTLSVSSESAPSSDETPAPWASLSTNDVIDVLEAATQRLTAEQLQREANEAVEMAAKRKQLEEEAQQPQNIPRPPSAPAPTTYVLPQLPPPSGSLSTRSDDAFGLEEFCPRRSLDNCTSDWRQPRRPRSTVPVAGGSLMIPVSGTVRQHDIVRSRLASLATRRLRDKMKNRFSTSSDRSFSSSDHVSTYATGELDTSRQSSASTPSLTIQATQASSSLATLLNNNDSVLASRSITSMGSSVSTNNNPVIIPNASAVGSGGDLYRCFYPSCTLSYDRPVRLHAHLLHHVYGMTGPYRCDVPGCNLQSTSNSASATLSSCKSTRTFPTTKQLWSHIESAHRDTIENRKIQPVDFTALRNKKPVSCPSCDAPFAYSFQLYLHLRKVHVRPSVRSSQISEKRSRIGAVKTHIGASTKNDQQSTPAPFACRMCGFNSSTMSALLLHLQKKQHQRQAARKHPSNGSAAGAHHNLQSQQPQPKLIFRGSSSFMHSDSGSMATAPAKFTAQPIVVDGNGLKTLLVFSPRTAANVQNKQQQQNDGQLSVSSVASSSSSMSSESSASNTTTPFYLLQRVVLVNVSQ